MMSNEIMIMESTLYLVPTPIGNIRDITQRALDILKHVSFIASEDTRRTGILLQQFTIKKQLYSLHEFNERKKTDQLIEKLKQGNSIALVSDAGTPLISDPGYHLVHSCHKAKIRVIPLPGACAIITALIASGLPVNRFCYEGFLPIKPKNRKKILESLKKEKRTLIFYESTHRVLDSISDIINIFGAKRYVVLARELTKIWETINGMTAEDLFLWIKEDETRKRGEIVLIIEGYKELRNDSHISINIINTLNLLQKDLTLQKALLITAKIYGIKKNILYNFIINNNKIIK
ncbi:Ribosomal RNA small subunit methyltransferase I [Candidatus Providencia siddallii]|uniref:Ribosomal RNA small subunit methyltransferase I n=1 Tax=Candidatus Providencia siddallii TaxID=1715285 RepID=A0A0M6W7A8_9GAMM|nr:Ribosomal RNA small subunit methyltransferase I [Candidatus Providencia siddallii]